MDILSFLHSVFPIIADNSNNSDAAAALPLVLVLAGFIFYALMYSRYRNADKRNVYERDTKATVANLQSTDALIQRKTGLSNSKMSGANQARVDGALNTGGSKLINLIEKDS